MPRTRRTNTASEALGTPLLAGSDFTEQDNPAIAVGMPEHIVPGMHLPDPAGPHAAIVNQSFVRHYFRDRSPLGTHVTTNGPMGSSFEIVAVVKDARYFIVRSAAEPMVFLPVWRTVADQRDLLIRTDRPETSLAAEVGREIHQLDPAIPLLSLRPLKHDVDRNVSLSGRWRSFPGSSAFWPWCFAR